MTNLSFEGLRNIIHINKGGKDGDAIPAVYVDGDTQNLRVVTSINGVKNVHNDYTLELGKEYKVVISQDEINGKTLFNIYINGELIYEIANSSPKNFGTVKVYTSDPWVDSIAGVGTVMNIRILDYVPCKYFKIVERFIQRSKIYHKPSKTDLILPKSMFEKPV